MIIRRELPQDRDAVSAVHAAAFVLEDGSSGPEARLVDELRADGDVIPALSLVATFGNEVVGHVVCSRGSVAGRPMPGLGPLGVRPACQRQGIGHALMHAVLGAADALDQSGVVLLGEPSYYSRFGFVAAESVGVLPPDPAWGGHFQLRSLTSWDGAYRGVYQYAAAFTRL